MIKLYEKHCEENEKLSDKQWRNKRYKKKINKKKIYKLNRQRTKDKNFDNFVKNKNLLLDFFENTLKNTNERN